MLYNEAFIKWINWQWRQMVDSYFQPSQLTKSWNQFFNRFDMQRKCVWSCLEWSATVTSWYHHFFTAFVNGGFDEITEWIIQWYWQLQRVFFRGFRCIFCVYKWELWFRVVVGMQLTKSWKAVFNRSLMHHGGSSERFKSFWDAIKSIQAILVVVSWNGLDEIRLPMI